MAAEVVGMVTEKLQVFREELTVKKLKELLKKYPKSTIFGLLLISGRFYLHRKWSFWSKRGVKGPPPSMLKMGNMTEFTSMFDGSTNFLTEKYGYGF